MFAHVMAFYSLGPNEVMALPVRLFWHLVDQIPRIEAYRSKRALAVAACSTSADGFRQMNESLESELGEVVKGLENKVVRLPGEIPVPPKEEIERAGNVLRALM